MIAVGGSLGNACRDRVRMRLGRAVVILGPGWELDGVARATTPKKAVDLALSRVAGEGQARRAALALAGKLLAR